MLKLIEQNGIIYVETNLEKYALSTEIEVLTLFLFEYLKERVPPLLYKNTVRTIVKNLLKTVEE